LSKNEPRVLIKIESVRDYIVCFSFVIFQSFLCSKVVYFITTSIITLETKMRETVTINSPRDIDSGLLEHARLGLKRIHTISQPSRDVEINETTNKSKVTKF